MRILRNLGVIAALLMAGICPVMAQGSVIATCGTFASPLPVRSGQPLFLNPAGELCVTGTFSVSVTFPTIGAAVPATGIYNGINVAGTLRGMTGLALGSTYSQTVAVVDASGNQVTSFGGTNASVGATGAAVPASATYVAINAGGTLTGWTGAVTVASGGIASGAVASGAVASGAYASGSLASGAMVDLVALSTPITPASATATKAINLGMQYNSTQATFTNGQQGSVQGTARGALYVATGADGFTVTGAGGTFPVTQSTSPWIVAGGGTAGTAATGVVTVQGIASMTKLLVTPDLPSGASTATNQTAVQTPVAAATATATKGVLLGGQYDSTQKTLTDGQQAAISASARGALMVATGADTFTVVANAGTNLNTSALATSANQTNASQKTQIVDGSGSVIASTSNNLNVQCANCSGSGASAVDQASFTAGTSVFAPSGVFYQTTPTANPLTNGLQGMLQATAQRAAFVNLRNASGTEVGVSGTELFVGGRGTAGSAAGGVLSVQGVASMTPVQVSQATASNLNAAVIGTGSAGTAATGVVTVQGIASMTPLLANPGTAANWGVGATAAAVPANAVYIGLSDGTNLIGWLNAANALNSTGAGLGTAQIVGQFDDTSPTSITENQFGNIRMSANRNLYGTIRDAAGNERGANVDASNRLTTAPTLISGSVASGAFGSGAFSSGAYATGSIASGAMVDLVALSTPIAANSATATKGILLGGQYDSTQKTLTTGQQAAVSVSPRGAVYVATGAENLTVTGSGSAGTAAAGVVSVQGIGSMTPVFVSGTVATNVAINSNPVNLGAQGVSSENAAVTTGRQVQLVADLFGKQIVLPYANPENFVSGVITSAMTGTTTTSLIAAPASGLRNYITACTFSNAHATVGTDMILQDGSGGTTIWNIPAAAVYGGAHITFPTPLRQPQTATALYVANVTTGASTKAACSGYIGG